MSYYASDFVELLSLDHGVGFCYGITCSSAVIIGAVVLVRIAMYSTEKVTTLTFEPCQTYPLFASGAAFWPLLCLCLCLISLRSRGKQWCRDSFWLYRVGMKTTSAAEAGAANSFPLLLDDPFTILPMDDATSLACSSFKIISLWHFEHKFIVAVLPKEPQLLMHSIGPSGGA